MMLTRCLNSQLLLTCTMGPACAPMTATRPRRAITWSATDQTAGSEAVST